MTGLEAIGAAALPKAAEEVEKQIEKNLTALLNKSYDDALRPGAKQIGSLVGEFLATTRLLAWPLQLGAALQERFAHDLLKAISRVPEDRRKLPSAKLFADVCDGSKFETDEGLQDLWSRLLSCGCDKEREGDAHPAFAGIIKELSLDEARLLKALVPYKRKWVSGIVPFTGTKLNLVDLGLAHPEKLAMYVDHLSGLRLLGRPITLTLLNDVSETLRIDSYPVPFLTDWGRAFLEAVNAPRLEEKP